VQTKVLTVPCIA